MAASLTFFALNLLAIGLSPLLGPSRKSVGWDQSLVITLLSSPARGTARCGQALPVKSIGAGALLRKRFDGRGMGGFSPAACGAVIAGPAAQGGFAGSDERGTVHAPQQLQVAHAAGRVSVAQLGSGLFL